MDESGGSDGPSRAATDSASRRVDLTITVTPGPQDTTLHVAGELDQATASQLSDAIEASIAARERHVCVLDLSSVEFVDSSGLSALIDAKRTLDRRQHELRMITNERIDRLLEMSGLGDYFRPATDNARPAATF